MRRIVVFPIVSLLALGVMPGAHAVDAEAPVLTSYSIAGGTSSFRPGEVVQIHYTATDDASTTLPYVAFYYTNPSGGVAGSGISGYSMPLSGTLSLQIPTSWPLGAYTLQSVYLRDAVDNWAQYHRDGTVTTGVAGVEGPGAPHSFDFGEADFALNGTPVDNEAPVLVSYALAGGTSSFRPGENLQINFTATDDHATMLPYVSFSFAGPDDGGASLGVSGYNLPLSASVSLTIPTSSPAGQYTLESVYLRDSVDNSVFYFRDGTTTECVGGVTRPGAPHSHVLADADFSISGAPTDNQAPGLVSFVVSAGGGAVRPGETIHVSYVATDDTSTSLPYVSFGFFDPAGLSGRSVSGYWVPLTGTLSLTIPASWPLGTYALRSIYLRDQVDNWVEFYRDGTASGSVGGVEGPGAAHTLDFAAGDFAVAQAPSAPDSVQATAGDGLATVRWSAAGANGSPVTGYVATASPGGQTCTTAGELECQVVGLINGTAYTFTVVGANAIGDSQPSGISNAVTPMARQSTPTPSTPGPSTPRPTPSTPAPTSPSATPGAQATKAPARVARPEVKKRGRKIVVRWRAPASNGAPITGYLVKDTLKNKTKQVKVSASKRRVVLRNLKPGLHRITVTAKNKAGAAKPSRVVKVRIQAPH
ncbi:MAG: fibronectin type III domain-containing protein [Micrococcales bacterium]|nr:fibronectin type III domain-containing protein [Micrococcales bacterium]